MSGMAGHARDHDSNRKTLVGDVGLRGPEGAGRLLGHGARRQDRPHVGQLRRRRDARAACGSARTASTATSRRTGRTATPPKQFHLDLSVDDLDAAETGRARRWARTKAEHQPEPDRWRVFLDPAGHPFCITNMCVRRSAARRCSPTGSRRRGCTATATPVGDLGRARHRRAGGDGPPGRARVRGPAGRRRERRPAGRARATGWPSPGRCAARRTCTGAPTSTRSPARCGRCPRPTPRAGSTRPARRSKRAGIAALEQYETAVRAMRAVGHRADRQGRGSDRGHASVARRRCGASAARARRSHISDSAMRAAFLPAGLGDASRTPRRRCCAAAQGREAAERARTARRCAELALAYLRFLGPATVARVRRLPRGAARRRRGDVAGRGPGRGVRRRQAGLAAGGLRRRRCARRPSPISSGCSARSIPYLQARDRDADRPGQVGAQGAVAGARPARARCSSTARSPAPGAPRRPARS